jgi:hypothetical protein
MKKAMFAALLFALALVPKAHAQVTYPVPSAAFTFGPGAICESITSWNGDSNAFPNEMGGICLHQVDPLTGLAGSYIDVPFQLGFLNNGYLAGCNVISWQTKVFTLGDGTHAGDTYTTAGSTSCPYYTGEYGTYQDSNQRLDGFNVVADYTMKQFRTCGRYGCHNYLQPVLTGGTGEVVETLVN